jgi:hypothetical protein
MPTLRRRGQRRHGVLGASACALGLVVVLAGAATVFATTVPRSSVEIAKQGDPATVTAAEWVGSGACPGKTVGAGKFLVGTAALETAAGGGAELVLTMHSGSTELVFSGPVVEDGTQVTLELRASNTTRSYGGTLTGSGTGFSGPLYAEGNGCRLSTTGTLTLGGFGLVVTTTTTTTTLPTGARELGGLDVAAYCSQVDHSTDALAKGGITGPDYAYDNWTCGTGSAPVSMQRICTWAYHLVATDIVAVATDPNSAYSWTCYSEAASTTGSTTPTTVVHGTSPLSGSSGTTNPDVAPIAAHLGTPGEVFHSVSHDLIVAIVTVGVMLFIAFPANIFNQTFQQNYEEILSMLADARRRLRRALSLADREPAAVADGPEPAAFAPRPATPLWFVGTLVIGAILGGLLKPGFGFNGSSIEDVVAALIAFAFATSISWLIARAFRRHHRFQHHTYLRALPLGLGIAAVCVVISRLTDFSPGYLYGVVVSVAWVESLSDEHNAHLTTISALSTLGVSLAAWLAWIPTNHLAMEAGSNAFVVLLDDALASIFIAGLVGTVINLLPLKGLPGGTIVGWRRDAWAAVGFLSIFLLIEVELAPASGPTHPGGAPIVTAIVLFVLFGALSFGTREFFERRHRTAATGTPVGGDVAVAPGPDTTTTPADGS